MKPFNKQLNEDINRLKILHAKKDKSEFNQLKSEVMKRHSISKATVYREMRKDVPGSYERKRSDRPVTAKEIQMVRELLHQQIKVQDIISVMERKTGMPYSWDRIDKIRSAMSNDKFQMTNEKADTESINNEQSAINNEQLGINEKQSKSIQSESESNAEAEASEHCELKIDNCHSAFGDNLRAFIDELMDADRIAEGKYITVTLGGVPYNLSRRIVKDITMIIANYAECYLSAVQLRNPYYDKKEKLLMTHLYMNDREPRSAIDELVRKQEAVLRQMYGPGGYFELRDGEQKRNSLPKPDELSEVNRIRILHLASDKIRSAVSGSFITLKELKELNEINRYFRENGDY